MFPQPVSERSCVALASQNDYILGNASKIDKEVARVAMRQCRWDCQNRFWHIGWDVTVEVVYRRIDPHVTAQHTCQYGHSLAWATRACSQTDLNLRIFSPS